ncbi:MAG: APC family permease, partial [Oscillospiraceae bacterium]|nr:APC family permease [Oscillospiraceae bacterium]
MNNERKLQPHLSPLGLWAFSVGTSVGWGSLVVTAGTYLSKAGPMGSVLGLVIGTVVMLLTARNYSYMMQSFPDAGGAYAYTREVIGYDRAFLAAWFLAITYFAILWANATSLPLFGRIFLGGAFRFGRMYTLFGYDVYAGEALLSAAALLIAGLLCMRLKKFVSTVMTVLTLLFSLSIAACFIGALAGGGRVPSPAYIPDHSAISQIVRIAAISSWAFIGFESVSHGAEEFDFERTGLRRILIFSVITTLLL